MDNTEKFEYDIIRHICTLAGEGSSVTKELNIVSYGGNKPKYDLRSWKTYPDGTRKMLKGLTLTADEMETLKSAMLSEDFSTEPEPAAGRRQQAERKPRTTTGADLPQLKEPDISDFDLFDDLAGEEVTAGTPDFFE